MNYAFAKLVVAWLHVIKENLLYSNIKGEDQPVHPSSLISHSLIDLYNSYTCSKQIFKILAGLEILCSAIPWTLGAVVA